MDNSDPEFLPAMTGILKRLHITSAERGYSMLAAFLDMARDEAEALLRHEAEVEALKLKLAATSSRATWRPGDFPSLPEDFSDALEAEMERAAAAA